MKKEKVYAAFLKEAFLKPVEAVSGKRLERQLKHLQKGKKVRPKQEAAAALESFLREKQLEPSGRRMNSFVRRVCWKPVAAAVIGGLMIGGAGCYVWQGQLKGNDSIGLEGSLEKDTASSWQETETIVESCPPSEAWLPTLEEAAAMSSEEIVRYLNGTSLSVLEARWGSPQQELSGEYGVVYYLPDGERMLVLYVFGDEPWAVRQVAILPR